MICNVFKIQCKQLNKNEKMTEFVFFKSIYIKNPPCSWMHGKEGAATFTGLCVSSWMCAGLWMCVGLWMCLNIHIFVCMHMHVYG